jgi:hypothetical protein
MAGRAFRPALCFAALLLLARAAAAAGDSKDYAYDSYYDDMPAEASEDEFG